MTCSNCNKLIQEDDKFCGFCGIKIEILFSPTEEEDVYPEEEKIEETTDEDNSSDILNNSLNTSTSKNTSTENTRRYINPSGLYISENNWMGEEI